MIFVFIFLFQLLFYKGSQCQEDNFCYSRSESECRTPKIESAGNIRSWSKEKRYVLYNVNPGEGFNLRRDVYLRISVLLKQLQSDSSFDWTLVLPPWGPLYHWKTKVEDQLKIPWGTFFNISCMNTFIPVVEFTDFIKEHGLMIDTIYYLQHEDWEDGKWIDKVKIEECKSPVPYRKENSRYVGWFWGYENIYASDVACVTFLGQANLLMPLILNTSGVVMIDRAEVVLHDNFGDVMYWKSRQSMRFASHLINLGNDFRMSVLNSTDESDKTPAEDCQLLRVSPGSAIGGNYIAVHLRRQDFLHSRKKDVPSLENVAEQLKRLQDTLQLSTIFVASDAPPSEMDYLKTLVPEVVQFIPAETDHHALRDGEIAIIDQWICAHARYFIGTHESTFSFRIQEEREILGFDPDTTFNRLCGDRQKTCKQPSRWRIVYK